MWVRHSLARHHLPARQYVHVRHCSAQNDKAPAFCTHSHEAAHSTCLAKSLPLFFTRRNNLLLPCMAVQHRTQAPAALRVPAALLAVFALPAVLAGTPDAVMLADAGAPAVLALANDAVLLADAGAPAVLAPAPDAAMLADACAPAVLAPAPLAVVLAFLAPLPRLRCTHPLSYGPQVHGRSRGWACGGRTRCTRSRQGRGRATRRCVCVLLLQDLLQSCSRGRSGGHVL